MVGRYFPRKRQRTVKRVIDGDTIVTDRRVGRSNYIRLANIDTPEKGQRGYSRAKNSLRSKLQGKRVWVIPVATDCYGRTVARVRKVRREW